ncbi:MAG: hypothetical protein K6F56_03650 [Oscillospiraceae bacterium]|nr:hypothetical protein [Oscillospiraceae bacterium]
MMCDHKKPSQLSMAPERLVILAGVWVCAALILRFLPNASPIVPTAGLASVLLLLAWTFPVRARKAAELGFRYRWALALLVFCTCVCLRLHGSSIGIYDEILPTQLVTEETTLFGTPRWIRSDEFGVATMKSFSQAANGYRLYSRQMSLSPTNMVLDYYSPAWDWTALGKPLNWGFLLFGSELGLSWNWCGEIVLLFMTALEMCLILTDGQRLTSLLGAVMVALSPATQWWFMPHMPPVILYAMALFCIGYRFFTGRSRAAGWGFAVLAAIAALGFALSIFPSFQVPCAYIVLALLIVCLRRDREHITFTRRDWPRIVLPAAAVLLILGRFLLNSRGDLALLLNTAYPGSRMYLGGGTRIRDLFTDIVTLFLPYKDVSYSNNCEVSAYIHFAPFFLVLSPMIFFRLKGRDGANTRVGMALAAILVLEIVYMLAGIPQWLAELTMLRFCNRMSGVYQWTGALFSVWGFSVLLRRPKLLSKAEKLLLPPAYGACCALLISDDLRQYLHFRLYGMEIGGLLILLSVLAFLLILLCAEFQRKRLFSALLILLMVFCGGTVNPVERGIGAVVNHPVSAAVSGIAAQEPESLWLCTDSEFILSNFLMANGARVLDATNFYPDREKWAVIDPDGLYGEVTNRYANQCAELTEGDNAVELRNPDYIRLRLNPDTLRALNIRYLFTPVDHSELLEKYGINCEYVTGQDGFGIYRLRYDT